MIRAAGTPVFEWAYEAALAFVSIQNDAGNFLFVIQPTKAQL